MIEFCRAVVRYGGRQPVVALQELSLQLQPGVTVVHGPAGAGKTTLLRVLATLQPLAAGSVQYPWTGSGLRARIGYVPQENRIPRSLSCEDGLRYLAAVRGLMMGGPGLVALLARWGLGPVRAQRLDHLSAGEARRWLLAQSQLLHPDLWILDEPLRGLDTSAFQTLRGELAGYARLAASGTLCYAVVASHDHRLDDLAGAIVRLDGGRLASR